ncbi:TIR domain-containing protein [Wukongibacter baidiensis]
MRKAYLSYSSSDKKFVNYLVNYLTNLNIKVWYDKHELKAGDYIKQKIGEGIKTASSFIIILSKESIKSEWVMYELNTALIYSAQRHGIRIIPIVIDTDVVIPPSLRDILYIDFSMNQEEALNQLIKAISISQNSYKFIPDWNELNSYSFEELVYDLLLKSGFENVISNTTARDIGYDFIGFYPKDEINGIIEKEKWIIEAKLYKNSKINVSTIAQLYGNAIVSEAKVILLVTSSTLTVTAKEFIEKKIKDIKFIVWDESKLIDLLYDYKDIYKKYFEKVREPIDEIVHIADVELSKIQRFIRKLDECPEGRTGWKEYEDICVEILNYLFVPPLIEPKIQSRTESGTEIRDAIYPNRGNHNIWGLIRNDYEAKYLVFEFKNYTLDSTGSDIDKHVVNQVKNYLTQTIGNLGFVCSKKEPSRSGYEARKSAYIENKKLIIFINNKHLKDMLIKKHRKEEPADVIIDLIDEFNINFG